MAEKTKIGASLEVDGSGAEKTVKSFKAQLKEANAELLKTSELYGATSKEAANAARKVAELKDTIGDAATLTDAFNPDAKFRALGNSIKVVSAGFQTATGLVSLFGEKNEDVEKALLKVQAAMAVTDGINNILEGVDVFKALGTQIKSTTVFQQTNNAATAVAGTVMKLFGGGVNTTSTSFKVLKGAIIGTGIGALVIGVVALIQNFDKVKQVIFNLIPGLSGVADFIGNIVNVVTDFVGITSEAGRQVKKTIDALEKDIKNGERFLDLNADKYDEYTQRKIKADLDYKKKKKEFLEDDKLTEAEKTAYIKQSEEQRNRLINSASDDRYKAAQKANEDAQKKQHDLDEKAKEKILAKQKEELAKQEEFDKAVLDRKYETAAKLRDADDELSKENAQAQIERDDNFRKMVEGRGNTMDINGDLTPEQIEARAELVKTLGKTETEIKLNSLQDEYKQKFELIKGNEELEVLLRTEYEQQKTDLIKQQGAMRLQVVGGLLGKAADLLGKQTAAGKILAIAEATMNTYAGATLALREKSILPQPFSTIQKVVSAGLIIGTGIKSVKEIMKTNVPNGGSSGNLSIPSTDLTAPLTPQATNTSLDQDSINSLGNAATRSYVISEDIQNDRETIERINRAARIG